MISYLPRYIFNFIFLVLVQVFVLNNIQFSGFVNPYLYILFILTLPFDIPGWLLLGLAFVLGMTIDLFSNTPGMHSAATVFMAFLRPYLLRAIAPRDDYQPATLPIMNHYGFLWFLKYAFVLVLAHHSFLFFIEVFDFSHFWSTSWRILSSTFFTLVFIFVAQLFSLGKNKQR
ncbi:rod shape-determining protein MreD [Marinilabiliaceae bacterium JC017]|nr:rod shape-determining protein MreD [Marinilabiliaceae bacterium JC017]